MNPASPSPTRSRLRRAGALAVALALAGGGPAACSGSSPSGDATAQITGCADLDGVTGLSGHKVTVATSFTGVEAERFDQSLARFEFCTGIDVVQKGSDSLESDMRALVDAADASGASTATAAAAETGVDVAVLPQPGLVEDLADAGLLTALPNSVNANIEAGWDRSWAEVGTVDGTAYAIPLQASVKSMVWYSPTAFKEAGYRVPTTWADLVALTEQIVKDRPDGDVTPWCLGVADGASSGWGMSDWLEDTILSTEGPGAYDKWAGHEVALDDTIGVQALDAVGSLVLADGHVDGGREGALKATVTDAAADLVSGTCLMLHGSSSLETLLPAGTVVTDAEGADAVDVEASGEAVASSAATASTTASASTPATATASSTSGPVSTGDAVSAFTLPSDDETSSPLLVGGDYAVALSTATADEKAVEAVLDYLSSTEWSQTRVQLGGVATANRGVDASTIRSAVTRRATQQLQSRQSVIRMDASDSMPSQVGTDALWGALTKYVSGELTSTQALAEAEGAWPKDDAGVTSSDGAESTATPSDDEH